MSNLQVIVEFISVIENELNIFKDKQNVEPKDVIAALAIKHCTFDDLHRILDGIAEKLSYLPEASSDSDGAGESNSGTSGGDAGKGGAKKPTAVRRASRSNTANRVSKGGNNDEPVPPSKPVGTRTNRKRS